MLPSAIVSVLFHLYTCKWESLSAEMARCLRSLRTRVSSSCFRGSWSSLYLLDAGLVDSSTISDSALGQCTRPLHPHRRTAGAAGAGGASEEIEAFPFCFAERARRVRGASSPDAGQADARRIDPRAAVRATAGGAQAPGRRQFHAPLFRRDRSRGGATTYSDP